MKVVHATWEQRNLGVDCYEATVEDEDTATSVSLAVGALPAGYHVVKCPVARFDIMTELENAGFNFIEVSILARHALVLSPQSPLQERMAEGVVSVELDDEGLSRVADEIEAGLFATDRVFLDPNFGPSKAAHRYVNWMHDEVSRGAAVYELRLRDGSGAGFYVYRTGEGDIGRSILAGLYGSAQVPGLGSTLLRKLLITARERGARYLDTAFSSNNLPVVKTHLDQGFTVTNMLYVYVRTVAES